MYFQSFFSSNVSPNMKKTWEGIRELIERNKKHKPINAIWDSPSFHVTHMPLKVNILNSHFASCGHRVAAKLPQT